MIDFEAGHFSEAEQRLSALLGSSPPLSNVQRFACLSARSTVRRCSGRWRDALGDLNACDDLIASLPRVMRVPASIDVYHATAKLLCTTDADTYDPSAAMQLATKIRPLAPELADELESDLALKNRDWERCIECSESALSHFDAGGWQKPVAVLRRRMGEARLGLGQLDRAADDLTTAYDFFARFGAPDERAYSAIALARLRSLCGEHREAWELASRALDDIDGLIRGFRVLQEQQQFVADKLRIYDSAFDIALRCGGARGTEQAWTAAERSKSFYLSQLLASADVPLFEGLDPGLSRRLKRLESEVDRCARLLMAARQDDAKERESEFVRVSNERQDLLSEMMRNNPRWAALKAPAAVSMDVILRGLPDDWCPVSYFWSSRGSSAIALYVFFRDACGQAQVATVPWTSDELRALNEAYRLFSGEYGPDSTWTLQQFASKFFPSTLTDCLRVGQRLLISPHLHNRGVPLHALQLGQEGFVFARWPVQYIPSMSLLVAPQRPAGADRVLLIGCPETPLNPGRLEGVPEEIQALKTLWQDKRPGKVDARVLGPNDSPDGVGLPISSWEEYGLLHVSCHGNFYPDRPFDAALFLGEDAVRATELFGVRLRASLAVLSACCLGATSTSTADEWIGMYLPLFYAGAKTVLVSLWQADTDTAERIMTRFHSAIALGKPVADALSEALVPEPHIPQLWANWYLVGVPDQLQTEVGMQSNITITLPRTTPPEEIAAIRKELVSLREVKDSGVFKPKGITPADIKIWVDVAGVVVPLVRTIVEMLRKRKIEKATITLANGTRLETDRATAEEIERLVTAAAAGAGAAHS